MELFYLKSTLPLWKSSPGGVWISNGSGHWAILFEMVNWLSVVEEQQWSSRCYSQTVGLWCNPVWNHTHTVYYLCMDEAYVSILCDPTPRCVFMLSELLPGCTIATYYLFVLPPPPPAEIIWKHSIDWIEICLLEVWQVSKIYFIRLLKKKSFLKATCILFLP